MFTNFDKAWFGPAFGQWIASGLLQFSERFFAVDIPPDMEKYFTLALVGIVVYFIPNKPKEVITVVAPASPTASDLQASIKAGITAEAPKA